MTLCVCNYEGVCGWACHSEVCGCEGVCDCVACVGVIAWARKRVCGGAARLFLWV